MPACRRSSISRARRTSNRSTCCGRRRSACRKMALASRSDTISDVILPLRVVPQDAGKPVVLAAQARLRDLREALRAGRRRSPSSRLPTGHAGAGREVRARRVAARRTARLLPPRRVCRTRLALGEGTTLVIRSVRREDGPHAARRASTSRRRRHAGRPVRRRARRAEWALPVAEPDRRRTGRTAALRLRARRCAARRQIRTARASRSRRSARDTRDRGHHPSRLIRRAR